MEPQELDFFTTQQLIKELMMRETFLGVVIHSAADDKGQAWPDEQMFKVHFNKNLDSHSAGRLLHTISERINLGLC